MRPWNAVGVVSLLLSGMCLAGAQVSLTEEHKLTPPVPTDYARMGWSVAVDGDTLVVGAVENNGGGLNPDTGAAYVYVLGPSGPVLQGQLQPAGGSINDWFGRSVAIQGDTIVVGAPGDDTLASGAGAAYVYARVGSSWTQQQRLVPSLGSSFSEYGAAVAVHRNRVMVGGTSAGDGVAVFERQGAAWTEVTYIPPEFLGDASADFGSALVLRDDLAIVGAGGFDWQGYDSGAVYSFHHDGTDWVSEGRIMASDGATVTYFGRSIAFDGDTLIAGATTGAVYLYERIGQGFGPETRVAVSGAEGDWGLGQAVAIEGGRAIVGSVSQQQALVLSQQYGAWEAQRVLVPGSPTGDFASAIGMSGDDVVVGAPLDGEAATQAGAAFVFQVAEWGAWIDLGSSLAGTHGPPLLAGSGSLVAGESVSVTIEGALENALTGLIIGLANLSAPFEGGTLVPSPDAIEFVATDASGAFAGSAPWPPGIPPGTPVYFQAWVFDAAASFGLAATNAVSGTTP